MGCLFYYTLLICLISYNIHIRTEKYKKKQESLENKKIEEARKYFSKNPGKRFQVTKREIISNRLKHNTVYTITQDVMDKLKSKGYAPKLTNSLIPLLDQEFSKESLIKRLDRLGFDKNQRELIMDSSIKLSLDELLTLIIIGLFLITLSIEAIFKF